MGWCGARGCRATMSRLKRNPWRTRYYAMQQAFTEGFHRRLPAISHRTKGQAGVGEKENRESRIKMDEQQCLLSVRAEKVVRTVLPTQSAREQVLSEGRDARYALSPE